MRKLSSKLRAAFGAAARSSKAGPCLSLVVAVGLVAGCDSKKSETSTQKTVEGTPGVAKGEGSAAQPETPKTMTGAELATKYQQCTTMINERKFDAFGKDCIADGYKVHDYGREMGGKEGVLGYFNAMSKAMPDWKIAPQLILVSGRNILAVGLSTGTHTAELAIPGMPPIPATSKKIGTLMFHRLSVNEQNEAAEEWGFDDPATLMGQLGLAQKGSPPTRPAMDKGIEGAPIIAVTADDAKEKANLETISKAMDAFNNKKNADMMAMMTDDVVVADQAMEKDVSGKKDVEAQFKLFQTGFTDGKVTPANKYAAGDFVVVIGKFDGTHNGDFMGMKKTGKKVSLDYAEVAQLKDGKVAKIWRFHSGMQLAQQLGLMPAAPPAGAAPAGSAAAPMQAPAADKK